MSTAHKGLNKNTTYNKMNNQVTKTVAAILVTAGVVIGGVVGYGLANGKTSENAGHTMTQGAVGEKQLALHDAMRELWSDHIVWTRSYLVAAISGSPDTNVAATRLLKNQEDIGAAVAQYYGNEAGAKLTSLLKDHILIAVDIVEAAKVGDQQKQQEATGRWSQNAVDMAKFLSQANPRWDEKMVTEMLNDHLTLTTDEAVARLQKNWEADVKAYDLITKAMMAMADELTEGIVHQFPEKF